MARVGDGWLGRLGRWLGGGAPAPPERPEPPEPDAAERLDAARDRLRETIEPPEDGPGARSGERDVG